MYIVKEVDFAAASLILSYSRSRVIDYSAAFYFQYFGILIRRPSEPVSLFKVFQVFNFYAWYVIMAVVIGGIFYIYLMNKLHPNLHARSTKETLFYCFWCVYKVVTVQGAYIKNKFRLYSTC